MFIKILDSAKKHGLTETEITNAVNQILFSKTKKDKNGKFVHMAVGMLPNGKTCELMYYICESKNGYIVFHAMSPAKNNFIKSVQQRKKKKG